MRRLLSELIQESNCPLSSVLSPLRSTDTIYIQDIQYDTRRVTRGCLFCALEGTHSHGKYYINAAQKAGAVAALIEEQDIENCVASSDPLPLLCVQKGSILGCMSQLSRCFFSYPDREIDIIGITGTDGKTTSISFLFQLAHKLGVKVGYWSTIKNFDGRKEHDNKYRQSTPESVDIFRELRNMCDNGCTLALLEASSHGLSHRSSRMCDLVFAQAGLTNIGHEHLDFHKTKEQYARDKSNLFAQLEPNSFAYGMLRFEEPYRNLFTYAAGKTTIATYSTKHREANYYAELQEENIFLSRGNLYYRDTTDHATVAADNTQQHEFSCAVQKFPFILHCPGNYNVENALLALSLLHNYGRQKNKVFTLPDICEMLASLECPEGRTNTLKHDNPFTVIIDYAHSPLSFSRLLPMLRKYTVGKLITVFGSAGERDKAKRPRQGALADSYADYIVLCNEDPRGENPMDILQDIASACTRHQEGETLFLIPDRERAIGHALSLAGSGDTVLFLGKGHERTQELGTRIIPWNEEAVVKKQLEKLPFRK